MRIVLGMVAVIAAVVVYLVWSGGMSIGLIYAAAFLAVLVLIGLAVAGLLLAGVEITDRLYEAWGSFRDRRPRRS